MPISKLLEYLAPTQCLNCDAEGEALCADCLGTIPAKKPSCYRCNALSDRGRTCKTCRNHTKLTGVVVGARYEAAAKELITQLKYHQSVGLAKAGARIITDRLEGQAFDLIVPVPAAPRRMSKRGYNQAALIAKQLSRQIGIPVAECLGRIGETDQIGKSRQQRLDQVVGQYYARHNNLIVGQRILVVDDVLTTGATLAECARVLRSSGAKTVWGAVIAKH